MSKDKNGLEIVEWNEKTDLIPVELRCPVCKDKYHHGVRYVFVPCKCGASYKTDFNMSIYDKKAKQLITMLSWNNGVNLRVSGKYESALHHVRAHFKRQNCWNISEIKYSTEEYRRCQRCGICLACFTCKSCGTFFEKDKNKRKQMCPKCKSNKFVRTHFKKAIIKEENKEIRLCPHCKSDKINFTRTKNKTKCHLCNSKELGDIMIDRIFECSIERKPAYRIEEVGDDGQV